MAVKQDRREDILQAMLELVIERGINDAPMSELSKRSGASAGIIYHYFANKDDIINQLYWSVKGRLIKAITVNITPDMTARNAFLKLWINAYEFYRSHPHEAKFLVQYEILPCYDKSADSAAVVNDPNYLLIQGFFKIKKEGGVIKELPFEVIGELTVGVAARLARQTDAYSETILNAVAEICWKSVLDESALPD